jgi:excisionase family DNA binding protein
MTEESLVLLLTPEQAADRLQVPVATLRRWVTEARVPYHRIGRKTRFTEADLQSIVALSQVEPAARIDYAKSRRARRGA